MLYQYQKYYFLVSVFWWLICETYLMFKTRRKRKIKLKDTGQWNCHCMGTRELLFPGYGLLSPYISLKKLVKWKHSLKDQRTFPLVIILLILITYCLYNVLISLRENRCWSSLGLKGFIINACAFTGAAYLWLHKVLNIGIKKILHTIMVKNIAMVILLQIIYTIFPSKKKKFCQSFFLEFSVLCIGINLLTNKYNLEVWYYPCNTYSMKFFVMLYCFCEFGFW